MEADSAPGGAALRAALDAVLADSELQGPDLRAALVATADRWLIDAFAAACGKAQSGARFALVAVGSLGRKDLSPASDLDLVVVHDPAGDREVSAVADALWYPLWDAKVALDHSVRTVDAAVEVADQDLKAALGMLDSRLVAGDEALFGELRQAVFGRWRRSANRRLAELRSAGTARAEQYGELAFLLEPDLKDSRGGMRDVLAIRAAAAAWIVEAPGPRVAAAYRWLLDVRSALQRITRRSSDRLVMQERAPVARALEVTVDELTRRTSQAGRDISFALDETWRRVDAAARPQRRWSMRRVAGPQSRPLDEGVIAAGGEVTLDRAADPARDPLLAFRVAAAAAQSGLPIAPATLTRLRDSGPVSEPWPAPARTAFLALLEAGRSAIPVFEALDQTDLLVRWLPEWESVRFRQQHNPVHRFTVDRHLVETAVNAATLARRVQRPDLLVLAGLLHDIGKGSVEDHTDAGVRIAPVMLRRMGFAEPDVEVVIALVQHHLLLPDTATRRDPDDPATVDLVVSRVGSHEQLDLLHCLTEADALAAGPAAWTEWKAGLVGQLVDRAHAAIGGRAPDPEPLLDASQEALAARGVVDVAVNEGPAVARVTVVAPDARGLLWRWAAVMALHRLEILTATATDAPGPPELAARMAVTVFDVRPRYGDMPDLDVLRGDLRRVADEPTAFDARLEERQRAQRTDAWSTLAAPPRVLWSDAASHHATVVEVRAHDSVGLLSRLARALTAAGLSVQQARIQTLGVEVVDAFYVVDSRGEPVSDPQTRSRIEPLLLAACSTEP